MNGLVLLFGKPAVRDDDFTEHGGEIDALAPNRDVECVHHRVRNEIVDHLGQLRGGRTDMAELVAQLVEWDRGSGRELLHQFGAAEDDAQRVAEIVGDGAKNFVLERVCPPQPRPLPG